jgi:hypothetical protein
VFIGDVPFEEDDAVDNNDKLTLSVYLGFEAPRRGRLVELSDLTRVDDMIAVRAVLSLPLSLVSPTHICVYVHIPIGIVCCIGCVVGRAIRVGVGR